MLLFNVRIWLQSQWHNLYLTIFVDQTQLCVLVRLYFYLLQKGAKLAGHESCQESHWSSRQDKE